MSKEFNEASAACKKAGHQGDLDLPAIDELTLIYLNNKLVEDDSSLVLDFWSRTPVGGGSGMIRGMGFNRFGGGVRSWASERDKRIAVRCVRADKLM